MYNNILSYTIFTLICFRMDIYYDESLIGVVEHDHPERTGMVVPFMRLVDMETDTPSFC